MKQKINKEEEKNSLQMAHVDKQKELVELKKKEKDVIKGKTKTLQDQINLLNKKIISRREKLQKMKDAQSKIEENKKLEIKTLNEDIRNNQLKIKEQQYFIQNLIPKTFIKNISLHNPSTSANIEEFKPLYGISLHNLRKPLSIHDYEARDSYLSPYSSELTMKKGKLDYPQMDELINDGIY